MENVLIGLAVSAFLLLRMLLLIEVGYRFGKRRSTLDPARAKEGSGAVNAALFGLLGLTLAFTFSGASDRLAVRRAQIVQEANAIGTAYLRIDMLAPSDQPAIRALFRLYLDKRIEVFDKFLDRDASYFALSRSNQLQKEIWSRSVTASQTIQNPATCTLVLTALIDITTIRSMATVIHAPAIIGLLMLLSFRD